MIAFHRSRTLPNVSIFSEPQFDQVALDCQNRFLARLSIPHSALCIPHSAIHDNPVKHGLCELLTEWPFSSVHRFGVEGRYR